MEHVNDACRDCGCDGGLDRREFLASVGAAGSMGLVPLEHSAAPEKKPEKKGAVVRAFFLYPPSKQFAEDPNGWWSWPGNDFDAEGRQKKYTKAFRGIEKRLGMTVKTDSSSVAGTDDAERCIREIKETRPDGVLLVMFYNRSLHLADRFLKVLEEEKIPVVFFIGLGVKHGPVGHYRRPGVYLIQALDDMDAVENGMRMINTKKRMSRTRLLSITEAKAPREGVEPFFKTTVRVIPFSDYAGLFHKVKIDKRVKDFIKRITGNAREIRSVSREALENAARAHFALRTLLEREDADGLTMRCLSRGMLKPCVSFSILNSELVPAACENDFPSMYTQRLGQLLTGRGGFQHNPCFNTERNLYYASHCTCPTRLKGPGGEALPYMLRRFAHSNEGSCAIQVFWNPDEPVTMVKYYPGKEPALDVYAGRVVQSHPMPPAAGCTTNVEIQITDRPDACMVKGHHNVLFCGDFARRFRMFAHLYGMKLAETGFQEPWPV